MIVLYIGMVVGNVFLCFSKLYRYEMASWFTVMYIL